MADYSAKIDLIVTGQQKLKRLGQDIDGLNKQLKELSRLDVSGVFEEKLTGGAVSKLRENRRQQINSLKKSVVEQERLNSSTERQLINQIKLNAAVDLYNRRLNEVSRTAASGQKQFTGRLEELSTAFEFFKGKGSVQGVQAVSTELGRIVEYSREVTRLELGRERSSQQIKDFYAQINKLKAAGLDTSKAEKTLEKFSVNAGTNKYALAEKYRIVLNSRITALREELRLIQAATLAEQKRQNAGKQRIGGAVSSALIGGGFPLLFGQGGGAAAGGAVGGLAGGLLGGGFGFALSIVGTAIGQAVDEAEKFDRALAKLNARVSGVGATTKITSDDIKTLSKNLGIAKDEAIKLLDAFAGFSDAATTKALLAVFGDDPGTLKSLAAVKDNADLAQVILNNYEKITVETASQLINQLKTTDSATVQLAFQKALLDAEIRKTEQGLKQVTIQDRLLAGLATMGSFIGGGGTIFDPEIYGQQRVEEFREQQAPDTLQSALKAVGILQQATRAVAGLRPDKKAATAANRAAKDAEKEAERVAKAVRNRQLNVIELERQFDLTEQIFEAETKKDAVLVRELNNQYELVRIGIETARALEQEKDSRVQLAIAKEMGLKRDMAILKAELDIIKIVDERNEKFADTISDLDHELALKKATTQAERDRLTIEYELQKLRKDKVYDEEQLLAIQARKTELAAPVSGADAIKQQIGSLDDELTKIVDAGSQAIFIAESIGLSFSNSFKGVITEAMTAQEALASFFRSIADSFLDMAAQIIAKWTQMTILNSILSLFPGGGGGGGGGGGTQGFSGDAVNQFNASAAQYRASGGSVSANSPYVVGEKGPELFVPGRSGTIVPNNRLGGDSVNVVVNVDAQGTQVQGNQPDARQLGNAISSAVQAELIRQKRPGGLLA